MRARLFDCLALVVVVVVVVGGGGGGGAAAAGVRLAGCRPGLQCFLHRGLVLVCGIGHLCSGLQRFLHRGAVLV